MNLRRTSNESVVISMNVSCSFHGMAWYNTAGYPRVFIVLASMNMREDTMRSRPLTYSGFGFLDLTAYYALMENGSEHKS